MRYLKFAVLIIVIGITFQIQTSYAQTAAEFIERAQAAQNKGDDGELVRNANEAIKLDAANALAYFLRGSGYFGQKRYTEAIADASKVIEIDSTIAAPYFLRGSAIVLFRPDDWKMALADFDKEIALDPTFPNSFRMRAMIYNEYGDDARAALDNANQAIKLDANYADAFFERGRADQGLKNWADAERDYSQAIKLGKNSARVYSLRAFAEFGQGKRDAAIADFRKSLELDPDDKQTRENLEYALKQPAATAAAPAAAQNSQSNISIQYAFSNSTYEKVMPGVEKLFEKLTTHRYPAPKEVSYMGKTTIVDPYGEDKNKLGERINAVVNAVQNLLESPYVKELTAEQLKIWQDRSDKIFALRAEAARRHLVNLVKAN